MRRALKEGNLTNQEITKSLRFLTKERVENLLEGTGIEPKYFFEEPTPIKNKSKKI